MQRPYTRNGLAVLQLCAALTLSCADEEPKPEKQDQAKDEEPLQAAHDHAKRQFPELRLAEYDGSLCPADSRGFSSSSGAATLTTSTDHMGEQQCRLLLEVTVPAGYRFRKPIVYVGGWALSLTEDESPVDAHVTMHYSMGGATLTSEHTVIGLPPTEKSDSFLLVDTPDLRTPECEDATKPTKLEFEIEMEVAIPDEGMLHISALDWNLVDGVRWRRCDEEL
jgi:hypothetical protein